MDMNFIPCGHEPYDELTVYLDTEESNLLRFVCAVDGVSIESKFSTIFNAVIDMAKLSLSLTGKSLQDAVKDWNCSKVCQDHPERMVSLIPEV